MKILIITAFTISTIVSLTLSGKFHLRFNKNRYSNMNEIDIAVIYLTSIIPVLNIFTLGYLCNDEIKTHNKKKRKLMEQYNQIRECKCCGLYSRSGTVELTEMKLGKPICSHCENEHYRWGYPDIKHDTKLPLCPKLTYKQCKIIEELKLNKSSNTIADSQLEKYQALQQKKMNEMLDKSVDTLEQYK